MTSCDLKLIMEDLAVKKTSVSSKRTAYLVPNMFNKIVSGYSKQKSSVNVQTQIAPDKSEVIKTEQIEKKYEVKALPSDVNLLKTSSIKMLGEPRRLLISTVFIQKLFSHRLKEINANATKNNQPSIEPSVAPVIPTAVPVAPVVPTTSEVDVDNSINKTVEKAVEVTNNDPIKDAVKKYVELMNIRKQALLEKQRCEKEMTELVNQFGITLDMVNAEIAKDNK